MDYPVMFNVCPCCSSPRRIIEEETHAEIIAGRLKAGARIPAMVTQSALYDPKSMSTLLIKKQITVMVGLYDVCRDCGNLYCVEMQKQTATVDPQIQGKMPPVSNGKGN
jgi:hypothetical protein